MTCISLSLSSCASSLLKPSTHYYKDIRTTLNGRTYVGVGVLPPKKHYKFEIEATAKIDVLFLQTNHREIIIEKPKDGGVFDKRKKAKVSLRPNEVEKGSLLFITALNRGQGKHSWGLYALPSNADKECSLLCNGKRLKGKDIVCQAKVGTKVRLETRGRLIDNDEKCSYKEPDFTVIAGICNRVVLDESGKYCRLYIYGYQSYPLREQ